MFTAGPTHPPQLPGPGHQARPRAIVEAQGWGWQEPGAEGLRYPPMQLWGALSTLDERGLSLVEGKMAESAGEQRSRGGV